jgi:type I pantothenate kinase
VVALQQQVLGLLDVSIYVDADESAVKIWFSERFVRLTAEARAGADSFYRMFADMSDDEVRAVAGGTWDAINGPNLHEHIEATRANAMVVIEKAVDHGIVAIRETA